MPSTTLTDEMVYRAHYARLVSLAAHMIGTVAAAEDVVQEAFEQYLQARTATQIASPGAWMTKVVSRRCLNEIRRRGRESKALKRLEPQSIQAEQDPAFLSHPELAAALSILSPRQRILIVLVEGNDMSVRAASAAVGCTASTASVHLTRARRALQAHTEQTEDTK